MIKSQILDQLLKIKLNGPKDVYHGICIAVADGIHPLGEPGYQQTFNRTKEAMLPAFQAWPKYSNNPDYPVPGSSFQFPRGTAATTYAYHEYCYTMWKADESYGALRWELLDFMLDYFGSRAK